MKRLFFLIFLAAFLLAFVPSHQKWKLVNGVLQPIDSVTSVEITDPVTISAATTTKFSQIEKSADAVTLTVAECSDTIITNRGWAGTSDQTFTLPEADDSTSQGLRFKFLAVKASGGTADTYIDTEGTTTNIYLDGVAVGDGERVYTAEIAIGESIECHAATTDGSAYDWFCDSINGTWLDAGS